MSLQRNYYEVLGIPPGATTDQIKKKYRELARKFHPDVTPDKVLGQKVFTQINQAYRVLADPDRREQYNSTLSEAKTAPKPAPASQPQMVVHPVQARPTPPPSAPAQTAASQPTRPMNWSQTGAAAQAGVTGQTGPARPAAQAPPTAQARPAAAPPQPGATQKAMAISGLLSNADMAIMAGKPIEARAFCVKVLEIEPRNARALEMLGDALAQMGRREEAMAQYRTALQTSSSSLLQAKLARLEQASAPTQTNPSGGDRPRTAPPTGGAGQGDKPGGLFGRFRGRK